MARPARPAPDIGGDAPLTALGGVGPALAARLAARGLHTVQDLWWWLPRGYEDRTTLAPIAQLRAGEPAQVEGRIAAVDGVARFRRPVQVVVHDASGASLGLRFFHCNARQLAQFRVGARIRLYGTPRPGRHGLEMAHPAYRLLGEDETAPLPDRLEPVYPEIDGVGAATLVKLVGQALARLPDDAALELLPAVECARLRLPGLGQALRLLHRPPRDVDVAALAAGGHPAQSRLAFEELLAHQISLRRQRLRWRAHVAPTLQAGALTARLPSILPFALTAAQARVATEIAHDLAQPRPMLRLVQGDVGSGKTVVAALAAVQAIDAGQQVALMAPTELLAEQHARTLAQWFEPLGVELAWLAGKVTGKARTRALDAIAGGRAQLVVGTHALMQEGVRFAALALAIVDEQHRFGVQQRLALRQKGGGGARLPHQLIMTATPIPRTLAMSAYADLDLSVIDALPPGRTPVTTVAIDAARRGELVERIRAACAQGRQAYWICSLIDEAEAPAGMPRIEAQAAQATHEALCRTLPELRIGLLHGRMKAAEKQAAMAAFQRGDTQLLVATTVVEVGVDVPNASLMVIENAERFGLSQLHQLRGRVGRGAVQSTCVLLYRAPLSMLARQRLDTLRRTNDGFVIAERDLQLRGPGELLGTRQTGEAAFRIADLRRDAAWLPEVQRIADALLADAPERAERIVRRWIGGAERYMSA